MQKRLTVFDAGEILEYFFVFYGKSVDFFLFYVILLTVTIPIIEIEGAKVCKGDPKSATRFLKICAEGTTTPPPTWYIPI